MKTIIAGKGEVGRALGEVLADYKPKFVDADPFKSDDFTADETCDILHIAFPWSEGFEDAVRSLRARFAPAYVVIHSTVPIGTSSRLGAVFSPVVGIHPHLCQSLLTFVKYLGGTGASAVADYFRRAGMRVYLVDKQETLELAKIFQTSFYSLMIENIKTLKRACDNIGLSFSEVYTLPATDYRDGYARLDRPEFTMPLLVPIMERQEKHSHCTINNLKFLPEEFDDMKNIILKSNEKN